MALTGDLTETTFQGTVTAADVSARGQAVLVHRGDWDDIQDFAAGDVVADEGISYVALIPATGADEIRQDTFDRPDQDGWGTSSDGHAWTRINGTDAQAPIVSHTGHLTGDSGVGVPVMMMTDLLSGDDLDYLVKWTCSLGNGPIFYFRATTDLATQCYVDLLVGSTSTLVATNPGAGFGSASFTIPLVNGIAYWTRIQAVGRLYRCRTWADGVSEPGTWDVTYTADFDTAPTQRAVAIHADSGLPTVCVFDDFRVTVPPVVAPANAPTIWEPLGLQSAPPPPDVSPVFAPRVLAVDSFQRADQSGWGAASDGVHSWSILAVGGSDEAIAGNAGHITANAGLGAGIDAVTLVPPLAVDDLDVVVRWSLSAGGDMRFFVRLAGDFSAWARLILTPGNADADFTINGSTVDNVLLLSGAAVVAAGAADVLWTRFRADGLTYSWRTWADGNAEPTVWDDTHTTTVALTDRCVGLTGGLAGIGDSMMTSHVTVEGLEQDVVLGVGTAVQLNYTATTNLQSGSAISNGVWTNVAPNQTFTLASSASTVTVSVSGFVMVGGTGGYPIGARVILDSGGTPITRRISGEFVPPGSFELSNALAGAGSVVFTGLAAGTHTVNVQVFCAGDGQQVFCRAADGDTECLNIVVVEQS